MDFINKGFSSVFNIMLVVGIFFAVIFLFFNLLPFIIVAGLVIWAVVKSIKLLRKWTNNYKNMDNSKTYNNAETVKNNDEFDLSNHNVIDVDYIEVK